MAKQYAAADVLRDEIYKLLPGSPKRIEACRALRAAVAAIRHESSPPRYRWRRVEGGWKAMLDDA